MKNQFTDLIQQSSEWIDAINNDYRDSDEIMELDTKEKLDLYNNFKEIFQEYYPKKIAALYGARETRIKMKLLKGKICDWIESANEKRNKTEMHLGRDHEDFTLLEHFDAIENLANIDLANLENETQSLELLFGKKGCRQIFLKVYWYLLSFVFLDETCPCDELLEDYIGLCDGIIPYIMDSDAVSLQNDIDNFLHSLNELKKFSARSLERIMMLEDHLDIFKVV